MKIDILVIPILFFLFGCEENQNKNFKPILKEVFKNKIIIENTPENFEYNFKEGGVLDNSLFDFQYFFSDKVVNIKLDSNKEKQIVEVIQNDDLFEIILSHNAVDDFTFLVHRQDSLTVKYQGKTPNVLIKNRSFKKHDLDYNLIVRRHIFKDNFPNSLLSKKNPFFYIGNLDSLVKVEPNPKEFRNKIYIKAKKELENEKVFLDSLKNRDLLSESIYDYLKVKNKYSLYHIDLKNDKFNTLDNTVQNDTLIKYKFYRDFIDDYYMSHFKIKRKKVSNGFELDIITLFDSVAKSENIKENAFRFLIYKYIDVVCETYPKETSKKYLDYFLTLTKDKKTYELIAEKFSLSIGEGIGKEVVTLIDENKKELLLQDIISKYKGKVVYVDFWASWCAPCRAAMPASRKLHEKYKNIEFVYISIDKNLEAWQKANVKEHLNGVNSLLATNYPEATFYKEHLLKSIPRYMIYHNGKLVNDNAPGPDSEEITKELEKYM